MIPVAFVQARLDTGGAERMLQSLVRGLDRARFESLIVTLDAPGTIGETLAGEGFRVVSGLASGRLDPGVGRRLRDRLRAAGVRVVFTTDSTLPLFWCGQLRRSPGAPALVVGFHSTGHPRGPIRNAIARASAFPVVDRFVSLAPSHRDFLTSAFRLDAGRFVEIPNGIDLDRFHPAAGRLAARRELGWDPDEPVVGIVAALRPEKHHELFVAAARRVASRRPATRFVVVGDGPERARIERAAAPLGDRIRFLGAREDVPAIQRALDVAVLASHPVVETLPLTLIEAHASGVPAVSTRVGSVDAVVEEGVTGFLVPPGDVEALAERIGTLLDDPARRAAFGAAARRRAEERFDVREMTARYERLFESLAG